MPPPRLIQDAICSHEMSYGATLMPGCATLRQRCVAACRYCLCRLQATLSRAFRHASERWRRRRFMNAAGKPPLLDAFAATPQRRRDAAAMLRIRRCYALIIYAMLPLRHYLRLLAAAAADIARRRRRPPDSRMISP